jgi:hypothetical protein
MGDQPLNAHSAGQPSHASTFSIFKATEDAKAVQIEVEDPTKIVQTGASLDPK